MKGVMKGGMPPTKLTHALTPTLCVRRSGASPRPSSARTLPCGEGEGLLWSFAGPSSPSTSSCTNRPTAMGEVLEEDGFIHTNSVRRHQQVLPCVAPHDRQRPKEHDQGTRASQRGAVYAFLLQRACVRALGVN